MRHFLLLSLASLFLILSHSASAQTKLSIMDIQGNGLSSAYADSTITTEGVITGSFYGVNQLLSFFIQDTLGDGDPATSDGIMVNAPTATNVNVGDYVEVTGDIEEYFGNTRMINITGYNVLATGVSIDPTPVTLPAANTVALEAYEGMYVAIRQQLTVTDNFTAAQFGEVGFGLDVQLIPTDVEDPNDNPASGTSFTGSSNIAAVSNYDTENLKSRIFVNDLRTGSNLAPFPFFDRSDSTLRVGSTVDSLVGCLNYSFGNFKIEYTDTPRFTYASRPGVPNISGADVVVASFNVRNFWTTLDERGAEDAVELGRQTNKLIAALEMMDADIVAFMEIENNLDTAINYLVDNLNGHLGSQVYTVMQQPSFFGKPDEAIRNVFIYKSSVVETINTPLTTENGIYSPPPIAMGFKKVGEDDVFILVANHYRFKGDCGSAIHPDDEDQNDGQGCFNRTRRIQSQDLVKWVNDTVRSNYNSDKVLLIGDFNAYREEDPMDVLVSEGYTHLLQKGEYTFSFQSEFGALDHALANWNMYFAIADAQVWHCNSPEPVVLDYSTSFKTEDWYTPTPWRSSDHDPVLIGINTQVLGLNDINERNELPVVAYPNPFDGEVTFEYTLETNADVQLIIYNQLGQKVGELTDNNQAAGTNKLHYISDKELSGQYYYELIFNEGKTVKRSSGIISAY